ncbi:MAG TPA: hypothetical protein VMZ27_10190, partial [Candidatus Saccharimonadales bacterium]|nr:hypothetical protein [Candidatus Saccharimonadales bacterium]
HVMNERALRAVSREDVHPIVASLQGRCPVVQPVSALGFFRAVTSDAGGFQDRSDVAGKVDLSGSGSRKFGWINFCSGKQ